MGAGAAARTRKDLFRDIAKLRGRDLIEAKQAIDVIVPVAETVEGQLKGAPEGLVRDVDQRRRYAGDPWAYVRDIFGYRLTPDQEHVLGLIERWNRLLVQAANNTGKSHLFGLYALYRFDAVAALPNEDEGLEEQGARILLPGPDHDTIFATIYSTMLKLASRAERNGFPMPGRRSENSVLWRVRPEWEIEAFSPKTKVGELVTHAASGRHHRNQIAIVEEGQGVPDSVWLAVEGMCSGHGNKIGSPFNPTEPRGPAYARAKAGAYKVYRMSALAHPNVVTRSPVIPDAVSHDVIDQRVRDECRDMGLASQITPDPDESDFIYALPPRHPPDQLIPASPPPTDAPARTDGIIGAPDAEPHVFRPSGAFAAQVLGEWPRGGVGNSIFNARELDDAIERWKAKRQPERIPDLVGLDAARTGEDASCAMPRWGEDAETLLRAYASAEMEGPAAVMRLREQRRQYVGPALLGPKGDGPTVSSFYHRRWGLSPFAIDETGVGSSVLDHGARAIGMRATGVSFSASALPPTPGEEWSVNLRTQLYVRAALIVNRGLADVPDDPLLREELLAHETLPRAQTVTVIESSGMERKERKPSALLIEKDEIKKRIGRSPDRADAFVLAVNGDPVPRSKHVEAW